MFGFLRPPAGLRRYRQAYARLCQYQRMHYGLLSLPFLSYEGALLYLFATEAGWFPAPEESAPMCCRLRKNADLGEAPEAPLGEFCASLGMLLGAIKLDDDVRDGGWMVAPSVRWLLRNRIRAARSFFGALDARFDKSVQRFIADHLDLECDGRRPTLERYAAPTAAAFGYVFGLLERVEPRRAQGGLLRELGRRVGAAIIAFDCAVDWPRDRRTGNYNPLDGPDARRAAFAYCAQLLSEAAALCRGVHGEKSLSAVVFEAVVSRVSRRTQAEPWIACGQRDAPPTGWRARRAGYAFSDLGFLLLADCPCEAIGACCEGSGACCEAGGGAAEGAAGSGECCGNFECCTAGADSGGGCAEFVCVGCDPCCWHAGATTHGQTKAKDKGIHFVEPGKKKAAEEEEPAPEKSPHEAPNL